MQNGPLIARYPNTMQILLAIPYAVGAVLSFRRYRIWALWLALRTILVATWDPTNEAWGHSVYTPLLYGSTLVLAMAALEAFYEYAGRSALVVQMSMSLGLIGVAAGWAFWGYYPIDPNASAGAAVRQIALCARVGITSSLVLAIALLGSMRNLRWKSPEFLHLLILTLMAGTFSVSSMLLSRVGWFHWWDSNEVLKWTRVGLTVAWLLGVFPRLLSGGSALTVAFPDHLGWSQSDRSPQAAAAPHHS